MMNILITGAFGFVGSSLARDLGARGNYKLHALDLSTGDSRLYERQYRWDSLDEIRWDDLDVVIHLAGIAHDTSNRVDESEYFKVNAGLTEQIFERFVESEAAIFIFFSSVKAVADSLQGEILNESATPKPVTAYGRSKLKAEQMIRGHSLPAGKKVYILRPCMIHGPGNRGNLNMLVRWVEKGIPYPLGAFRNKRSFTSMGNLTFIIGRVTEGGIEPGTYNIADSQALSTCEVVEQIGMALQRKVRIWRISKRMIRAGARVGDLLHLPLNSERLSKLTEDFVVSNRKLLDQLGGTLPLSSREGLQRTLQNMNGQSPDNQ